MIDEKMLIEDRIIESMKTKQKILDNKQFVLEICKAADVLFNCIKAGGKILVCGNGGSASDSLHMVGEIVGRFQRERNAWPAIALNADVTTMTAVANDYSYDDIFARSVEAYMKDEDVLIGISTSGNSENVYRAMLKAKTTKGKTILLTGKDGGKIADEVDISLIVPASSTARIQESHIMIIHILCELLEEKIINE